LCILTIKITLPCSIVVIVLGRHVQYSMTHSGAEVKPQPGHVRLSKNYYK